MNKNLLRRSAISTLLIWSLIISGFIGSIIFNGIFDEGSVEGATIIVDYYGNGDYQL